VTAIRKLHTFQRPGLFEAALGGLFLALFQLMAALTYPNVFFILSQVSDERQGFVTTWALIIGFSVIFSMVGAALGHLAFAPLRPLQARTKTSQSQPTSAEEEKSSAQADYGRTSEPGEEIDDEVENSEDEHKQIEQEYRETTTAAEIGPPQRSLVSYLIAVVLLGLAPTLVGFMFTAAFDYMQQVNLFFPGPYPTLRLLSAMLPWQIPISFNPNGNDPNASLFLLLQLWRIPLFLGNPRIFDVQALEPFVFNGAALGLLLLNGHNLGHNLGRDKSGPYDVRVLSWPTFLLLEIVLGLLLVIPADVFIVRGLQGLLQDQIIAVPIRTLYILDQTTFMLNLITGPLVCMGIGIVLRLLRRESKLI